MKREPAPTVPCYACRGRFGLSYDGEPYAYHTVPYCSEFKAIESTDDAVRHSERCRKAALS